MIFLFTKIEALSTMETVIYVTDLPESDWVCFHILDLPSFIEGSHVHISTEKKIDN